MDLYVVRFRILNTGATGRIEFEHDPTSEETPRQAAIGCIRAAARAGWIPTVTRRKAIRICSVKRKRWWQFWR